MKMLTSVQLSSAALIFCCVSVSSAVHGQSNSPFIVNGVRLGENIQAKDIYPRLKCGPSSIFANFTWCATTLQETGQRGSHSRSISALHNASGATVYSSLTINPAFFAPNEINQELSRLTKQYGQQPKTLMAPPQADGTSAIIVTWGAVSLEPLDEVAIARLAQGETLNRGFMVDFIGNFRRSAQNALPVYLISGGEGMIWSASFDKSGKGHLRITAADPSQFQQSPQTTASPSPPNILPNTNSQSLGEFLVLNHRPQSNEVRFVSASIGKLSTPEEVCSIFQHPVFLRSAKDHEVWSQRDIWDTAYQPKAWLQNHLRRMGVINRQGFVELEQTTQARIEQSFSSCITRIIAANKVSTVQIFFEKFLNRKFDPSCMRQNQCLKISHILDSSRETMLVASLFIRESHPMVLDFLDSINTGIEKQLQELQALANRQRIEAERQAQIEQQRRLEIQRVEEQNRVARERQAKIDEILGRGDLTSSQKQRMIQDLQSN